MNRISLDTLSADEWVDEFNRAIAYWGYIRNLGFGQYEVCDRIAEEDRLLPWRHGITWSDLDDAAKRIVLGETEVAPLIASYIVADDIDDPTGDCIVQIAALGELRYG